MQGFSLVCAVTLTFKYTSKIDRYISIWWGKFELECLLIIFIYLNPKCKVTCKNVDFECRFIKTHFEEKSLKFVLFLSPLIFFSHLNSLTNLAILSSLELTFLWLNHQMRFKMVQFSPNNAKSRVHQSQACFLTHLVSLKCPWPVFFHFLCSGTQIRRGCNHSFVG